MRGPNKRIALPLALAAALAAGAGATGAVAAGPGKGNQPTTRSAGKHRAARGLLKVVTDYLGVTPKQLLTELRNGKSLAQVAVAHGKTAGGLKLVIVDAAKTRLDRAVANGRLTREQATQILAALSERLDTFLNRTWPTQK